MSGILVALLALNFTELWILWLLRIGFFCASALSSPMGKFPVVLCGIAALAIITTLIFRRLPIHSLDWGPADRIEFSDFGGPKIVITDPAEISALMQYGKSGHYESMIKSGTNIHMYAVRQGASRGYYVHGDSIGDQPGGMGQTVFIPERDGFLMSVEGILARHGHKKKRSMLVEP